MKKCRFNIVAFNCFETTKIVYDCFEQQLLFCLIKFKLNMILYLIHSVEMNIGLRKLVTRRT